MRERAIEVRDVTKTIQARVWPCANSFEVQCGEVFGLLGPNGAGKSTTVRLLATLSRATTGSARIAGFDVCQQPKEVRRRIGSVGQTAALDLWAWPGELHIHGRLRGLAGARLTQRVAELIEMIPSGAVAGRLVQTYSGGMRRRLDLATGLLHSPSVLFLDEPTTGLDPDSRYLVWEHIRTLAANAGAAILLTTHYMDEADSLAGGYDH